MIYILVLTPQSLTFRPQICSPIVTLLQRYVFSTKFEVYIRLSCFEKIGGMGLTDGPRESRIIA